MQDEPRVQSNPIPIPVSPAPVASPAVARLRLSSWLVEDLARLFNQGE